jgi:hypothetical protein
MDPMLREFLVGLAIVLSFCVVLGSVWMAASDDTIRLRSRPRRRRWKSQVR